MKTPTPSPEPDKSPNTNPSNLEQHCNDIIELGSDPSDDDGEDKTASISNPISVFRAASVASKKPSADTQVAPNAVPTPVAPTPVTAGTLPVAPTSLTTDTPLVGTTPVAPTPAPSQVPADTPLVAATPVTTSSSVPTPVAQIPTDGDQTGLMAILAKLDAQSKLLADQTKSLADLKHRNIKLEAKIDTLQSKITAAERNTTLTRFDQMGITNTVNAMDKKLTSLGNLTTARQSRVNNFFVTGPGSRDPAIEAALHGGAGNKRPVGGPTQAADDPTQTADDPTQTVDDPTQGAAKRQKTGDTRFRFRKWREFTVLSIYRNRAEFQDGDRELRVATNLEIVDTVVYGDVEMPTGGNVRIIVCNLSLLGEDALEDLDVELKDGRYTFLA